MYGCCSWRQLRPALSLTRGAACGQRGLPGIPPAGIPGATGSREPVPSPQPAAALLSPGWGGSRGLAPGVGGAKAGSPGWARAALANPPCCPPGERGQRCRPAWGCPFFFYSNIAAVWGRRHGRAARFPRPAATAGAAKLGRGLLPGSAVPRPPHARPARPCPPLLPPLLPPTLLPFKNTNAGYPAVRGETRSSGSVGILQSRPPAGWGGVAGADPRQRTDSSPRSEASAALAVQSHAASSQVTRISRPEPSSALGRGRRARDAGHTWAWVCPVSSPRLARPHVAWGGAHAVQRPYCLSVGGGRGAPPRCGPADFPCGSVPPTEAVSVPPRVPEPPGAAGVGPGTASPPGQGLCPPAAHGRAGDTGTNPPHRGDGHFAEGRREDESSRRSPGPAHLGWDEVASANKGPGSGTGSSPPDYDGILSVVFLITHHRV